MKKSKLFSLQYHKKNGIGGEENEELEVVVDCCGFPISKEKYYNVFKLVEVKSTFYNYLRETLLEKWRRESSPRLSS